MDRLISEQAVLEAFREYQGSISDFYKAVKAIPSTDIDILIDGADAVGYRRGYKEAQLAISSADIEQAYMKGREDGVNDFLKNWKIVNR